MMSEPMSDEDLAQVRAMMNDYMSQAARKGRTPAGIPVHLFIADDIVSQALESILAEVDRLRAENEMPSAKASHWFEQAVHLQEEVAAMRPIVEALAADDAADEDEFMSCSLCGGENKVGSNYSHEDGCPIVHARAYLAEHPVSPEKP